MKRLWLAAFLLLAVVGLCGATQVYQQKQIEAVLTKLDELQEAIMTQPQADALPLAKDLLEEFRQRTRYFPCYMSHNDLSGCYETAATLPTVLANESRESFLKELVRFRAQLQRLRNIELPTLQNIF